MEPEALARLTEQFNQLVRERLPGASIQRVVILQYGDDPEIEPGQLLARIHIEAADDKTAREQAMEEFHQAHRTAIRELRRDLDRLPGVGPLEIIAGSGEGEDHGPRMRLGHQGSPAVHDGRGPAGPGDGPARAGRPGNRGCPHHGGHRGQPRGRRALGPGPDP